MGNLSERNKILAGLGGEVAFAVLPLIVVLLVALDAEHAVPLFAFPEWSFGAAILFGQTLVKFISGVGSGGNASKGPVALAVSLLIVLGLAPSLIILNKALQALHSEVGLAPWARFTQVVLFLVGAIVYMLLGTIGEMWRRE